MNEINIDLTALTKLQGDAATGSFLAAAILCKAIARQTGTSEAVQQSISKFLEADHDNGNAALQIARSLLISIQDSFSPSQNSTE
jgi:hypothetical protein